MDSNLIYVVIFLIASVVYYYVLLGNKGKNGKKIKLPPQPARAWPIIGHLHLLPNNAPIHRIFADMADKAGPIISLRVGTKRNLVVVNQWEEAKECFTVNDKVLLSRPMNAVNYLLGYDLAMFGNTPYGDFWRWMRKVTVQELLSTRRADMLRDAYESEIRASIKDLHRRSKEGLVDFKKWCKDVMFDLMLRILVGKRGFSYSGEYSESRVNLMVTAFNRFVFHNSNMFHPWEAISFLWWADFQGHKKSMIETAKELDDFVSEWLAEHHQKRKSGHVKHEEEDLMDLMLSIADKGQLPNNYDADTCIKATILEFIVDGVETTSSALVWALTEIVQDSEVLKKAQEELDRVVGRDRWLDESDISKIPYIWAVIKESMRLHPATPLLAPREATEDCTIGGYDIPKGTALFINAWKVMRDPRVWPEPLKFWPERFLAKDAQLDVRGQHFHLIPFSSGRRSCAGMTFTLRMMPLLMGQVLQGFNLKVPSDKPIDDSESPSLSLLRAHPLEIEVTRRLGADMYV